MNQQKILQQIQLSLKDAYHKAVDADHLLQSQKEQGNAKFQQIFNKESPFRIESDTFLPYIEELAGDLLLLQEAEDEPHFVALLQPLINKLNLLLKVMQQLKGELSS